MGGYTHYEVEFNRRITWDEEVAKKELPLTVSWLYLKDFETERLILSVYSQTNLDFVLGRLSEMHREAIVSYRSYSTEGAYSTEVWKQYLPRW